MKTIKNTEEYVLTVLERNLKARTDDFILFGGVLKEMGVDLRHTSVYDLLANAKFMGIPSFETVTRCRRHIQELRQDLKDGRTAIAREERKEDFKIYNISGIGE